MQPIENVSVVSTFSPLSRAIRAFSKKFSFLKKSETKHIDFDRKSMSEEFKNLKFEIAVQKKISWLWFDFIFNLKPKKRK